MKKIWIFMTVALLILSLCSPSVLAVSEGEVESQVAAQGKEKVTGNILIWFLCAIAFLKVSQKIDTFMSSLGINVGHTGGNMLGELMVAIKGVQAASGGAFGHGGSHGSGGSSEAAFLSGGLAGAVGRMKERHAADSVTNQQNHPITQRLYNASVAKGGDFANTIIGTVAKGSIAGEGTITGDRAAEAMKSYFRLTDKSDVFSFTDTEIGGGRITGKVSVNGTSPKEFAMYNAEQYMKPEGECFTETAADGSKWYRQMPVKTVQRTPYLDDEGEIRYNEKMVMALPQIPRRKDKV